MDTVETVMDFLITTDKTKMDMDVIHTFLSQSYWSEGVPIEVVKTAIENSLCFGVFKGSNQVGFARVITDYSTFAYLCDVFILEEFRGLGLSKKLMSEVMNFPKINKMRRFMLATKDAHDLYKKFGFKELGIPERYMEIHRPDIYKNF